VRPVRRRSRIAALIVALVTVLAGCAQIKSPTYDIGALGCVPASDATLATLSSKLTVPGTLRNGMVLRGDDGYDMVSAELHRPDDDRHTTGDLLTFASRRSASPEFVAVDVNAREESSWPGAPFDVRAEGARQSRACANVSRGKTKAQIECERRQGSSGNVPLSGNEECSDL
jgi:hypothetical protein